MPPTNNIKLSERITAAPARGPRNVMIDCAKGIGIMLIVLMHIKPFNLAFPHATNLLFSCVVSFFFFLSGVTFSLGDRNIWRIAKQRADGLLKPCLVVLFVLGLARIAGGRASIEETVLTLTYLSGFSLPWPPLWFLPHLWLVSVFCAALLIYCKPMRESKVSQALILMAMLIVGYGAINAFSSVIANGQCEKITSFQPALLECGLPFSADLLLLSSAFFISGHLFAAHVKALSANLPRLIASLVLLLVAGMWLTEPIDLNARLYPYLVLTPVAAFLGTYVLLQVAAFATKVKIIAAPLSYCGNASLFILIFHTPILAWLLFHLPLWISSPLLVSVLAFVVPIVVCIGICYAVQHNRLLAPFMLPRKTKSVGAATAG